MSGVRLHKEYGLNPTCGTCIVCGESTGEIALLGASYKEQAPMHMVISIEPCQTCRDKYLKEGILLLESKDGKSPNGTLAVLKESAFKRLFTVEVPTRRICFVEEGLLKKMGMI